MNNKPILSIEKLSCGYGNKTVIRDVSLDIYAGEFCALLGLNGSGKTTLLKAVCGLIDIMSGSCFSDGIDISSLNEKQRAQYISFIPQRFSKLIGVTVFEAVLMGFNPGLGVFDIPSASDKLLAEEVLNKMQILQLADEDFSKLSEGQKQLVILSRTLVQNAPIMLMDEPDSALDFPGKHGILSKIKNLIHNEKKAGLITLHDPNLALAHCERLILLDEGRIITEINLNTANKDEIHEKLSSIYKGIKLDVIDGRYIALL